MSISSINNTSFFFNQKLNNAKKDDTAQSDGSTQPIDADAAKVSISRAEEGKNLLPRFHAAKVNFKTIDTDNNGELSKAELEAAQQKRQAEGHDTPFIDAALNNFEKLDSNGDGSLNFLESHPRLQKAAHKNFDAIDQNADGSLSPEELATAQQKRHDGGFVTPFINRVSRGFDKLDTNGDGALSFEEAHPLVDKIA